MTLEEIYAELKALENRIKQKGLPVGEAELKLNWCGAKLSIELTARDNIDVNGYWRRGKTYEGSVADAPRFIDEANKWVSRIPDAETRAVEFTVQKLNELATKLPTSGTELMKQAMELVKKTLMDKAERLAARGLPSPDAFSELEGEEPPLEPTPKYSRILDDEIPF